MKRGLFLYGVNCDTDVWSSLKSAFPDFEITFAAYPHEITQNARCVSDITQWVFDTYRDTPFDFLVGHSMGGIVALELVSRYKFPCDSIIFIESNLRPAEEFYRNLMTPSNMQKFGDRVRAMLQRQAPYYTAELKSSLQEDFDFTPYLNHVSARIFGVYGDRGVGNYAGRVADLCLGSAAEEQIRFRFVKNACHMPMIENPAALADIIRQCVTGASEK